VECRQLPLRTGDQYLSLDIRLLVGRRWLKLLKREKDAGSLTNDYQARYIAQYPVPVPDSQEKTDAAICAHKVKKGSELSIDIHRDRFMIRVNGQAVAHRVSGRNLSCA